MLNVKNVSSRAQFTMHLANPILDIFIRRLLEIFIIDGLDWTIRNEIFSEKIKNLILPSRKSCTVKLDYL